MESSNTKRSFLFKLDNKKKLMLFILLTSIVVFLFIILYSNIPVRVDITTDMNIINQIEQVHISDNTINITGYSFILNMDSYNTETDIILRNVNNNKDVWSVTEQIPRKDVSDYYRSEFDYLKSGFSSTIKENRLKVNECYEIIVKLNYNSTERKTVSTNKFLLNGELYSYNPFNFEQPENTESDLLNEVYTKGHLCFYNKEAGMYLYQYNNRLYWVANESFDFNDDSITYIPYQLFTSQLNMLPEHRIQYTFDNLDFIFEENELKDENLNPYRVVVKDIPNSYPITSIITGVYDTENNQPIWDKQFQIDLILN